MNRLVVATEKRVGELSEKDKGVEKYRLVDTDYSQRCNVHHRKYTIIL